MQRSRESGVICEQTPHSTCSYVDTNNCYQNRIDMWGRSWNWFDLLARRAWRYQRGNQNPYIEEEQTIQWTKEKVQKDKQRSTKHTYKTEDRVTRTPLKPSSCSTSGTRRVNLVTNPVASRVLFNKLCYY